MNGADGTKRGARRRFRSLRQAIPPDERRRAAVQLADTVLEWLAGGNDDGGTRTVAAYRSVGTEPETEVLLTRLIGAGYRVLLPVCEPEFQLVWTAWTPAVELRPSPLAPVLEPTGRRETVQVMEEVGLILLPALAADTAGNRLGQGGGYYDRFLASLSQISNTPRTGALVYEHELVAPGTFEHGRLDVPVHMVFTPGRWQSATSFRV